MRIPIYIYIEAVFMALVGTIQKIITRYICFSSKTGSDRMGSYYIMCFIMPCAGIRKQNSKDWIGICLHASVVMISIKRQGSVRKMVIITNLWRLVQNTFLQKNKNECSLDKAKKKLNKETQTDVKLLTKPTFSSLCWFNLDLLVFCVSISFSCIPSPIYADKVTI